MPEFPYHLLRVNFDEIQCILTDQAVLLIQIVQIGIFELEILQLTGGNIDQLVQRVQIMIQLYHIDQLLDLDHLLFDIYIHEILLLT